MGLVGNTCALTVKERPILFNGEMVRAILGGRKTQTRRILKLDRGMFVCERSRSHITACEMKDNSLLPGPWWHPYAGHAGEPLPQERVEAACPYGKSGDRLWVRETWSPDSGKAYPYQAVVYRATDDEYTEIAKGCRDHARHCQVSGQKHEQLEGCLCGFRWRPSIHMPRDKSRITLEVTGVRVERLQEISEADAIAEGLSRGCKDGNLVKYGFDAWPWRDWDKDPRRAFQYLWGSVQADPDETGWGANPWTWVIEFKRVGAC